MSYRRRLFVYVFVVSLLSFWAGRALPADVPFTIHPVPISPNDPRPFCDPCHADGVLITRDCRNDPSLWVCEKAMTSDGKEVVMCRPKTDKCPRRDS